MHSTKYCIYTIVNTLQIGDEDQSTLQLIPSRIALAQVLEPQQLHHAVAVPAGLHGVVSPYDGNQEEWVEYTERLEHYFIANDIADVAKRLAILLNGVGAPTYRLIKTLALPAWYSERSLLRGDS